MAGDVQSDIMATAVIDNPCPILYVGMDVGGAVVGVKDGTLVGRGVGTPEGKIVGRIVGTPEGEGVGIVVGRLVNVGMAVGAREGGGEGGAFTTLYTL